MFGECINGCTYRNCFGNPHASCFVVNHKARCRCKEGYEKKEGDAVCNPISGRCTKDDDCAATQVCRDGGCIHGCIGRNCFGDPNAYCFVLNHDARCRCKDGYTRKQGGDVCKPIQSGECRKDDDCKATEVCEDGSCIDGCKNRNCFGDDNAYCFVINHDAWCRCKDGYERTEVDDFCKPKTAATKRTTTTTTTTATGKLDDFLSDLRLDEQFSHELYVYMADISVHVK
jgi:hypothetical protein